MIIAVVYGNYDNEHSVAERLIVTSSEEEMATRLQAITSRRLHPQPIPNTFEVGQKIALGRSRYAFAKVLHTGPIPEGGLVV
jgi:hypothetical protein